MSDMGDTFRAWGEVKQAKRASNRKDSAAMLREAGIQFEDKNGGAHLIVQAPGYVIDFWPGTGKWSTRGYRFGLVGRGVRNLLDHLKQDHP